MNWRDLILENRWQKLFALGLAVLIWFTVRSTQGLHLADDAAGGRRTFANVPIVVLTSAADLGRYAVSPANVDVELRGDPSVLRALPLPAIEAYVNLVDLGATPEMLQIHVNPPEDTDLVSVKPVRVLVDRLSETSTPNPATLQP